MRIPWPRRGPRPHQAAAVISALLLAGCGSSTRSGGQPYSPLAELEGTYGPLITAGNHPTPDQHGTGDRVGLFRDAKGTVWGLPIVISAGGEVMACAPPELHDAKVTGSFPASDSIIGSTNTPTGWRGGTGKLELLLRDTSGKVHWIGVSGGDLQGPACWAQELPGPPQRLQYYRLVPAP